ncbi:MAG: hypothetical protein JXR75_03775 [Rhodobacteraceae bacterium]|nr:hypothetical protein [Paracoccaceae bacterium]
MFRFLSGALVAATMFLVGSGAPAAAATLGLTVDPSVGFAQIGATEITDDGASLAIVNGFGMPLAGFGFAGSGAFDLFVTGDSFDMVAPVASMFIDGTAGSVVGDLLDFALSATVAELLFQIVSDDFSVFGPQVLMVLTGDFSLGFNATDASVAINPVAAVPLPATLPLLLAALGAGAALRRRRA